MADPNEVSDGAVEGALRLRVDVGKRREAEQETHQRPPLFRRVAVAQRRVSEVATGRVHTGYGE